METYENEQKNQMNMEELSDEQTGIVTPPQTNDGMVTPRGGRMNDDDEDMGSDAMIDEDDDDMDDDEMERGETIRKNGGMADEDDMNRGAMSAS